MNLTPIFLTGLLTGGLTCLAVQGGLLAAAIARDEEEKMEEGVRSGGDALPIGAFLAAKLAAYTLLGFLLGWFGSLFELSVQARLVLQFAVIVFMLGNAFHLLDLHPVFRYFVIQPPKRLMRLVRNTSKAKHAFAPALLGAFTVFIPCGTTQAMMALAIASGNPAAGALILFAFILGTSPLFFALGYFAAKLGDAMQRRFLKLAAIAIIAISLYSLNGALVLAGSPVTLSSAARNAYCSVARCYFHEQLPGGAGGGTGQTGGEITENPTIYIYPEGYRPGSITVKAGSHVKIRLINEGGWGCAQAFTIPKFNVQKIVPPGESGVIEFDAPEKTGPIAFTCSMGMYGGVINVVN